MHNMSLEYVLALGYAVFLLAVALLLEMVARYVHQRSLRTSTVGFTYRPDSDTWSALKTSISFRFSLIRSREP